MRNVFFVIATFFLVLQVYAQRMQRADSLIKVLNVTKDSTQRCQLLASVAGALSEDQPLSALKYADSALRMCDTYGDSLVYMRCNLNKGIALDNLGRTAESFDAYNLVLTYAISVHDTMMEASCYGNIGMLYSRSEGNAEKSIENHKKGLALHQLLDDDEIGNTMNNIAIAFHEMGQIDSAIYYNNKALAWAEAHNQPNLVAYINNNLGTIYFGLKDYNLAFSYFEKSKKVKEELGDMRGMASAYANIGELYSMIGKHDTAIQYLQIALSLANSVHNKLYLREIYRVLSEVYVKTGNYTEAYNAYVKYTEYKDSLFGEQKADQILKLQKEFETVQQEKENEFLRKENDIKGESIRRKDILTYVIAACLILALVGGIYMFNLYRQKRNANLEISRQKVELEVKNKEVHDSITYAKRIQYTLLANTKLLQKNIPDHFVLFKPKDIVSGDFYWATETEDDSFYLAACDSTGHGVPGAFMSLLNTSFLNEAIAEKKINDPAEILGYVRDRLVNSVSTEGAQDGMDGTLVKIWEKKIVYAAANNNPVIVRNGVLTELPADKMAVGAGSQDPFNTHSIECTKGDVIFIFTDGYADQFGGPKGKKFKYKQLYSLLEANAHKPMEEQKQLLDSTIEAWRGNLEQVDDICIIGFRI
jgi:serine phosphatase RsbU (regulator of sigma subunit)/Tfp pilus assembly protein PilF